MPATMCAVHPQEEMTEKTGKHGNFWSHRTDDSRFPSGWCNGRVPGSPYQAPVTRQTQNPAPQPTQPEKSYNGRPQEFWDRKSKIIALCGMANATIQSGRVVDVNALGNILKQIEAKAAELTDEEQLPF